MGLSTSRAPCLSSANIMAFARAGGLAFRGLAQSATGKLRLIKPLASGEPLGPKLDEIGKHS